MKIPLAKLKATLLFFANNTNPTYLGKIKLMKLFYFLDFMHIKKYGIPVTGDTYYHLEKGPIPTVILNLVDQLVVNPEESKLSDSIQIETPAGTRMQRITPTKSLTDDDLKMFSKSELDTLAEVAKRFKDTSTDEIIKASHAEAPWRMTDYLDVIPYALAGNDTDSQYTSEEIELVNSI
ncbi:MAG TPA: Panacea domain-containing protein [Candidatus Saccharimonadales bacterium]|nr:Panacea domain-containing protein [Candidatus Saccharimonadales bacterium]